AYSDGDHIVSVIACKMVVFHLQYLPTGFWKPPSRDANIPFLVIVTYILITLVRDHRVLLEGHTVDRPAAADRQCPVVHNNITGCLHRGNRRAGQQRHQDEQNKNLRKRSLETSCPHCMNDMSVVFSFHLQIMDSIVR